MQAYLVNCNPSKVEKSLGDSTSGAILLYLDYDRAKEKCEDANLELGAEFFQVLEVNIEVV